MTTILTLLGYLLLCFATGCGTQNAPQKVITDSPENRSAQADRYLEAVPIEEMIQDMSESMAVSLHDKEAEGLYQELMQALDIKALEQLTSDALVKHFTAEELSALASFYGSDVGKSAMEKLGPYMADVLPSIQGNVVDAVKEIMSE